MLTNEQIDALDTATLRKLVKRLNEWSCGEDCHCPMINGGDGFVCSEWMEYVDAHGLDMENDREEYDMELECFHELECDCMCALEYELWKIQRNKKDKDNA